MQLVFKKTAPGNPVFAVNPNYDGPIPNVGDDVTFGGATGQVTARRFDFAANQPPALAAVELIVAV